MCVCNFCNLPHKFKQKKQNDSNKYRVFTYLKSNYSTTSNFFHCRSCSSFKNHILCRYMVDRSMDRRPTKSLMPIGIHLSYQICLLYAKHYEYQAYFLLEVCCSNFLIFPISSSRRDQPKLSL